MSLLLLFNGSVQGVFVWSGPDPELTAHVEPEDRASVAVSQESRVVRIVPEPRQKVVN